ncbi:DUF4251 domain-containing protein [Mucilaginibacter conchicola]|uniref:DUF4251 domain-containing protein n=1 Tax=Mucilaginibacter conchicola TaxID=2303333 RepID=A0A372NWG4_9SPHI|nr:DUF4251 domain-containing protein [Mucilaginibacter conchicola]RFZ94181.1 DUF4251 domain-containing protein [Mucilaginibacter conchicola]
MKRLLNILTVVILAITLAAPAHAQTDKQKKAAQKAQEIKALVDSKNFVFQANYMYPMGGGQRFLTSPYDITIAKDTVTSFLPYFGVAYNNAGYNNNNDAGIKFTSTKFDYTVNDLKKGGYRIFIKPNDVPGNVQMYLDVYFNGYANLSINSVNRQSIRFDGVVKDRPKTKN